MSATAVYGYVTHPFETIRDAASAVACFFGDVGRAGHAAARYQHLISLSDSELEVRGCTREDAARLAFDESFGKL